MHAVLVTYRRPDDLVRSVSALAEQTALVTTLVVVDNDGSAAGWCDEARTRFPFALEPLLPGDNLGPAGGFARGIEFLLEREPDDDWVVLLDDDDPLPSQDMIQKLTHSRDGLMAAGVRLGGVGGKGGRFCLRRARTLPVPRTASGRYEVDHLHGGYAPMYRLGALREAGNFRPELFWGFEELDMGLRLNDAGWRLFVDVEVLRALPRSGKLVAVGGRPRLLVGEESPARRYYAHRNLTYLATERSSALRLKGSLAVRQLAKPAVSLPLRPRLASTRLRWNLRARRDARLGRMGRTVSL